MNIELNQSTERIIRQLSRKFVNYMRLTMPATPYSENSLYYQPKQDKAEYGYYINDDLGDIIIALSKYELNQIIDLGCGPGHIISFLQTFGYKVKGFEIEDQLITDHKISHPRSGNYGEIPIIKKNILTLTTKDLTIRDPENCAIYFYEPLTSNDYRDGKPNDDHIKSFVSNLVKQMSKGQYILYKCAGNISTYLYKEANNKNLEHIENLNSLIIYRKL